MNTGWIPPSQRTPEQQRMTGEYHDRIGTYASKVKRVGKLPERVILDESVLAVNGKLLPRIHQTTGSCVGASGARAVSLAIVGDVVRGSREAIKIPFPYATYGVGRELMGERSQGDGSFGAVQAQASQEFGELAVDHPKVPQPTIKNGWATWSSKIEYQWSIPKTWPTPRSELAADAKKSAVERATQLKGVEDTCEAIANFCGVTIACGYIPPQDRESPVKGDVLIDPFAGRGGHQQSVEGYWFHPQHGLLLLIGNQWTDIHGHCPTLFGLGITTGGQYWVTEKRFTQIANERDTELYAYSATGNWDLKPIDHGTAGIH